MTGGSITEKYFDTAHLVVFLVESVIQHYSFSIICVNLEHWSVRRLSHDLLVTIPGIKRIQEQHPLSQCEV